MATTTATAYSAANLDDVLVNRNNTQGINNNGAQYDTTYCDIGDHPTAAYAPVSGYIFTIPALSGWSGNNSDIVDCYVEWYNPYSGVTASIKSLVKLIYNTPSGGAFPSSFSSTNNPLSMYNAATGISGVAWDTGGGKSGSWTQNTYGKGPSVTDHLKTAFTAGATAGSSKVTVVVYGVTSAGPNNGIRANSYNYGSNRPRLVVTYNFTATDATPTPSPVTATATVKTPLPFISKPYTSAPTNIWGDLYLPPTTKPSNGYPTVLWVHGGRFVLGGRQNSSTEENDLPTNLLTGLLNAGYAVASIDYLLATETVGWNYGLTHPMPVKHAKTALRYWQTNAAANGLDPNRFVVAGYSAGAEIAALAGLSIGDTTTYTFRQNGTPDGRTQQGKTSSYAYEVNGNYRTYGTQGSGLNYYVTSGTEPDAIKGILLYACPVDLEGIKNYNSPSNTSAVNSYTGFSSGESVTINGEGSVDKYIAGTSGSVYAGSSHTPDVPIAHYRSTGDTTIIPDAVSATPLYDTLNTAGVDVSKAEITSGTDPAASAMSLTGLTRFAVSGTHAQTVFNSDPDEVITWLNLVTGTIVEPSNVSAVIGVPSATVDVSTAATVTPSPVGSTISVGAPSLSIDSAIGPPVVTAVASIPAPSVVTTTSVSVDTDAINAVVAVPGVAIRTDKDISVSAVGAAIQVQSPTVGAGSALSAESVTATATVPSVIVRIDSTIPMSPVNATGAVLTASVATSNAMQKVFMNGQWKTIGSRQAYINGSWKSF